MNASNGHPPATRAARRRIENNTPTLGAGAAGDTLGQVIGFAVAQALAPMLASLAPQKIGCLYCAARRKMTEHAYGQAAAALHTEYEIACNAAAELGGAAPEKPVLEPPPLPPIQEAFTWVPVVVQAGTPAVSVPVCYDDLPNEPAAATGPRPTGLVTGDGRPVIAQAG